MRVLVKKLKNNKSFPWNYLNIKYPWKKSLKKSTIFSLRVLEKRLKVLGKKSEKII